MADEKYITQEELTKTLSDFKTDLLESIKQMELEVKGSASPQLLKTVYNKWFHDATKRVPDNLSKPFKQVSSTPYIWKIWDAMRALTCAVCDAKKVENITNPAIALDFCEKLCEFTYEYMIDCAKEKKKNTYIKYTGNNGICYKGGKEDV